MGKHKQKYNNFDGILDFDYEEHEIKEHRKRKEKKRAEDKRKKDSKRRWFDDDDSN